MEEPVMEETEKILLESLKESSKKTDKFLYATIIVCSLNVFTLFSGNYKIISKPTGIEIDDPVTYFLICTVVIMVSFSLTGLHLINYLIKRFSYERLLFKNDFHIKEAKRFPITQNTYEFIFDRIFGKYFEGMNFSDASRRTSFVFIRTILFVMNLLAVVNSGYLVFFVSEKFSSSCWYPILLIPVLVVIISVLLWRSFIRTIKSRREMAQSF